MDTGLLRKQLHQQLDQLPDDLVEQIADYAMFLMSQRDITPLYEDWGDRQWQEFALSQFFREDDEVEYTLKDAKEIYRT